MNNRIIYITVLFLLLCLAGYSQTYNLNNDTNGSTITTCNATLYDSGGPNGQYSDGENFTITFCGTANAPIIVEVVALRTESASFDYLKLYDGPTTGGTLMATLGGTMPAQTEYEASGNCITITWRSDGSVHSYDGFELSIRCGFPCQDYTVTITPEAEYDATEEAYLGCSGGLVSAQLNFPNNNQNYEQTIDNTMFSWSALNNNGTQTFTGLGLNELDLTGLQPFGKELL
ncbi:MAG: hypothetical protein II037_03085 [Bacteroidales bacterium]|nr:hypothetical protein [Bacteroidales bacterium]